MSEITVPGLPFPVEPSGPVDWRVADDGAVSARAAARTDIFVPPGGDGEVKLDAATLLGEVPDGDFQLSARVAVDFRSTFDAGVLLLWLDERHWAKLCSEFSPSGEPMVVSVVNRTVSDDANAFVVEDRSVWLRISRTEGVFAFHASLDGHRWAMVRLFALEADGIRPSVGLEVQSPTGDGCDVAFSDIRFSREALRDPRDGS